jgi:hypothetical protein
MLPKVNSEIGFSVAQSIGNQSDHEFLSQELKKLEKNNPVIAEVISRWSKKKNGRISFKAAFCGILVYKLLESQAEVDSMDYKLI